MIQLRHREFLTLFMTQCFSLITIGAVFSGCQLRKSQVKDANSNLGLDLMDTAILYPPAGGTDELIWPRSLFRNNESHQDQQAVLNKLSDSGFWPQLLGPKNLLPKKVFDEIIIQAGGDRNNKTPGAGINFELMAFSKGSPASNTSEKGDIKINVAGSERWRITSFRYDPCPYSVAHGLPASEEAADENTQPTNVTATVTLKNKLCKPEFRLVAQPFIGMTQTETDVGGMLPFINGGTATSLQNFKPKSSGWFAADFALHLFYRLEPESSIAMAQALLDLKTKFKDLCNTTGVPLQAHPCLVREAVQLNQTDLTNKNSFATELFDLYSKYTLGLHKIAVFGSESNASPWMFFVGNVAKSIVDGNTDPKFTLSRIKALDNFDFTSKKEIFAAIKNKEPLSKTTSEIDQIKAERLSQRSIFTQRKGVIFNRNTALGTARAEDVYNRRILPPPHPTKDSLAAFVMGTVGFQSKAEYNRVYTSGYTLGLANINATGKRNEDIVQVVSRIENPRINNEFKTDCVSCHMANMEGAAFRMELDSGGLFKTSQLEKLSHPNTSWRFLEEVFFPESRFVQDQGLTTVRLAPSSLSHKGTRAMVYMLNQFSIYRDQPIISQRALNETAEAASFTNKYILAKNNPWLAQCNMKALEMCTSGLSKRLLDRDNVAQGLLETYDWYAAFLNSQECFRPERMICKTEDL